jgi:hypothetical protein
MEYLKTIYFSLCSTPEEAFVPYISQIFQNFKRVADSITGVFRYLVRRCLIKYSGDWFVNSITTLRDRESIGCRRSALEMVLTVVSG